MDAANDSQNKSSLVPEEPDEYGWKSYTAKVRQAVHDFSEPGRKLTLKEALLRTDKKFAKTYERLQLNRLIASAKAIKMTEAQRESQRRSFAYGNGNLSDRCVSRDSVEDEANRLAKLNP